MERRSVITFDDSVKKRVVKALGFKEEKGTKRLVRENGKIAISQDFQPITMDNFGGVLQGSKIPIKNDESELIKYFVSRKRG